MNAQRYYLEAAMDEAKISFINSTYPVGAVIVGPDGKIIGRGHNHVYSLGDFTAHAEMEAIRFAGATLMSEEYYYLCTLYTTLEPCFMCCGAILHARIARVLWIMNDYEHGVIRDFCANPDIFNNLYNCKLRRLKASHVESKEFEDLEHTMNNWMAMWGGTKKSVEKSWSDKIVTKKVCCARYEENNRSKDYLPVLQ